MRLIFLSVELVKKIAYVCQQINKIEQEKTSISPRKEARLNLGFQGVKIQIAEAHNADKHTRHGINNDA